MTDYRGVTVPADIESANIAYKALWEKGVDMALDAVLDTVRSECKYLRPTPYRCNTDGYDSGLEYGMENAADIIEDAVEKYNKE